MCEVYNNNNKGTGIKTVPVTESVGMIIAHDITEIIPGKFKGRAFKKGHIVREQDICRLQRLGKENLFILEIKEDEMHENDAAYAVANSLAGEGVKLDGEPHEGRINLLAEKDGLLKIDRQALFRFNMLGEVMCATIHNNSVVREGQVIAGTRAIPLVVKKSLIEEAVKIAGDAKDKIPPCPPLTKGGWGDYKTTGIIEVKEIRKPRAGIVITGNEVYYGKIKDAFEEIIKKKITDVDGEVIGVYFAPDNAKYIEDRIRELIAAGADLIITTGGMSVDPDDVTRFAIRNIGVKELTYGTPVLPGAMFLVAYLQNTEHRIQNTDNPPSPPFSKGGRGGFTPELRTPNSDIIPILGIPACGMYSNITVFDMILPRILAGEIISREELAELGHGGLCLKCEECRYPVCPFGK